VALEIDLEIEPTMALHLDPLTLRNWSSYLPREVVTNKEEGKYMSKKEGPVEGQGRRSFFYRLAPPD